MAGAPPVIAEIWRPVVGYVGIYEVSDRGNVRSLECKRGHQLADLNLCNYGKRTGVRACLACNKARRYIAHHGGDMQTVSDAQYVRIMSGEFEQRAA